jgi:hypothetical protein
MFPKEGGAGSFWEDRGDRHHAGLDLYAAPGSRVVAIESGIVLSSGIFTSPDLVPYWNVTYQITIAHNSGIVCRYAELGDLAVKTGDRVVGGEVIGHVGEVLDLSEVGAGSPPYIRALKDQRRSGMLHLEVFTSVPGPDPRYQGGNWFTSKRPSFLLDPALVLRDSA